MYNKKFWKFFTSDSGFYLWVIFILNGIIAVLDWRTAIPIFLIFIILLYNYFRRIRHRQKELTRYIENLTYNIDTATKDIMRKFPMPMAVLELDGSIIWHNSSFKNIFTEKDLLENIIYSIIKGLSTREQKDKSLNIDKNKTLNIDENMNIDKQITINNVHYRVLGSIVNYNKNKANSKENYILLLYFIDNTELVQLKSRYEQEKVGAGIIIIDNYDELMQNVEDSVRPHIVADIDKQVMQWISASQGIVKKIERDRYLFIFMQKYLSAFENKKFDILDNVKEISHGNKIPVTLSIGIGFNNNSLTDSLRDAEASIDIALGRGGDQAVIKNNGNFKFYGGKTRETEKRTKVKARVIAYALKELINQSSNVLIMGHQNGDIDSLGASLGVYRIAKNMGKEANIILHHTNSTIDAIVSRIENSGNYSNLFANRSEALEKLNNKTLLIVVDTYRKSFTEFPEILDRTDQVVVIDHHRKGTDFIQNTVLVYHETYASSTCELVTEILQYVDDKLKLNTLEAEALYSGIIVDTKNFTYKTGVRTFEAASYLRRQGVDTVAVRQLFQNDMQTYLNISNVVRDAEIINTNIAISQCRPEVKNVQLITAKAADELLSLAGISAAFVLGQVNNEVFISGRSLGDINVQVIMENLGGGGHFTVAGTKLQGISIEQAKEKLKYVIIEYIKEREKEG
ncbi:MAG TPA: phosphoesterase [Clostridiaceae bacterium]|nr:phosphoesterase [Clostridiaceae bacterium]